MASGGEKVQKELHKSRSGLRMVSQDDSNNSPFLMEEPPWISDNEVHNCQKCGKKFDFINRRHHCRRCGKIFCNKDTKQSHPLPRLSFVDPVRMCESCATITIKENDFFNKHLKLLLAGAQVAVSSTAFDGQSEDKQFQVKLSTTHRFIEFSSSESGLESIDLNQVTKIQVQTTDSERGAALASGITLKYTDFQGIEQTTTIRMRADNSKRQAGIWIVALQKGMKLIFNSRTSSE